MTKNNLLLIEDDETSAKFLLDYLISTGFNVDVVFTATDGLSYIQQNRYDLLLLDLSLPDYNGFEILTSLKNRLSLPIIVISSYSDTHTKVQAFKFGASDYMVKPLDLEELEARIWSLLGRNSSIKISNEIKDFTISGKKIFYKTQVINLTKTEFDILELLIKNENKIAPRDLFQNSLSSISSLRSLDFHIKNIRKKIETIDPAFDNLKTEYGVGYKLLI